MDPIEIFELSGYVIDATASNPDLAVFVTDTRSYVIQRASPVNAVFASEIRTYIVQSPTPKTGVSMSTGCAYVIIQDDNSRHISAENTTKAGAKQRKPGAALASLTMYTIEVP